MKFVFNFNEAILTAEIAQTFYKLIEVNVWSSIVIWFIPSILYFLLSGLYRVTFFGKIKYNYISNKIIFIIITIFNILGFFVLYDFERLKMEGVNLDILHLVFGIISFTLIDISTKLFNNILFEEILMNSNKSEIKRIELIGFGFDVSGKIIATFISSLYVILNKTHQHYFIRSFPTNIQFSYFIGIILNIYLLIAIIFTWPKILDRIRTFPLESSFDLISLSLKHINNVKTSRKFLLFRVFITFGIYWTVATTITQWISFLFCDTYELKVVYFMNVIDVGTSWGNISLLIFYALWGLSHLSAICMKRKLIKNIRIISFITNLLGFAVYLVCFFVYGSNPKYLIVFLGMGGLFIDTSLIQLVIKDLKRDTGIYILEHRLKEYVILQIMEIIEFLAELFFFLIIPVLFSFFDDKYWMLGISCIFAIMMFTIPDVQAVSLSTKQIQY